MGLFEGIFTTQWVISGLAWWAWETILTIGGAWIFGKELDRKRKAAVILAGPVTFILFLAVIRSVSGPSVPDLRADVITTTIMPLPPNIQATTKNKSSGVLLTLNVRNYRSPSIIDGYSLIAHVPNGQPIPGELVLITEAAVATSAGPVLLRSPEALYNRTVDRPLTAGSQVRGFLYFKIDGFTTDELIRMNGVRYEVGFHDFRNRKYVTDSIWSTRTGTTPFIPGLIVPSEPVPLPK
jgi:hypothetical protein